MKRFVKRSLLALLGGTLLVSGLVGCAANRWHGDPSQMQARMVERVSSKLDLNDAQKQKLTTLAEQLRAQRDAMRADGDPRQQMQALVAGPRFDQAAAARLIDEKTAQLRKGSPQVIAAAADFYDSLDPAQQQKVRDFMARGRGHGPWHRD